MIGAFRLGAVSAARLGGSVPAGIAWNQAYILDVFDGQLLVTHDPPGGSLGDLKLLASDNGGQSYFQAAATVPDAMHGLVNFEALANGIRTSIYVNSAAGLVSSGWVVSKATSNSGPWTAATGPYAGVDPENPLVTQALAPSADSSALYIVARTRYQEQASSNAMSLYSSTDGGVNATLLGAMTVDPADTTPSNGFAYFNANYFQRASLFRIGTRWFLMGANSAWYNDSTIPLTGWKRCQLGLSDLESNPAPILRQGFVQLNGRLYARIGNVSVGAYASSGIWAYSDDNGTSWTTQPKPAGMTLSTDTFSSYGYAFNGSVFFWTGGTPRIAQITPNGGTFNITIHDTRANLSEQGGAVVTGGKVAASVSFPDFTTRMVYSTDGFNFSEAFYLAP